ncbi:MAG: transposase [Deltaproteobacteria bacterium]|nr:transposase [Deltaproteobacteria bacterium]
MKTKYFMGCDVSKGYADFVILNEEKQCVENNFQLDDTFSGHNCLYERLTSFFSQHPGAEMFAAVESTGGYENNWYSAMRQFQGTLNIKTARLNPCGVHASSRADMRRTITDAVSARSIAEHLISYPARITYEQDDYWASLRKQWSFVQMLSKQKVQMLNQLESLVYSANPEILTYCRDGVPEWVLNLLKRYPTATKLAKARNSDLVKISYVTQKRAEQLKAQAKTSVASSLDDVTCQLIIATVEQVMALKQTIASQNKMLSRQCSTPEVELLKTFNGIGDYSAIGLLLEIQSVKRFSSVKKLAAFFGLHPIFKISGDGSAGFRMSKQGRKAPRSILFMVAMSAVKSNILIRDLYQEKVSGGMEKMAAIGLCMHKILRIIYGMLKTNTPFDPEIDLQNKKKASSAKNKPIRDKNRRFQTYDDGAPVSRRNRKKRLERKSSQGAINTKCGIEVPAPAST